MLLIRDSRDARTRKSLRKSSRRTEIVLLRDWSRNSIRRGNSRT